MAPQIERNLVIIGGGFAGAVTALNVLNAAEAPLDLTIVEPAERLGRGIAYASDDSDHVVNGLAGSFALDPAGPERFLFWLEGKVAEGAWQPPLGVPLAASSPPRGLYGAYVEHELQHAIRRAAGRLRFTHLRDRAVDIQGGAVVLASGRHVPAQQVVLATGLHRRETALGAGLGGHSGYARDVFNPAAFDRVAEASHALILGSGLTMLDALISAEKRGFRGRYTVVSRRGLLVAPRREVPPWPGVASGDALPATARGVLRWIQRERRAVRDTGEDWQRLPPLFREHTSAIWARLEEPERARLIKYLVPFWNLSQHRAATASYAFLERVRAQGRLTSLAGTVTRLEAAGDRIRAYIRPRGERAARALDADLVLSALGYEFDWTRINDLLVRSLLARGLVVPHPLGMGITADPSSLGVVGADGRASQSLFAIGHPLRGELWEASSIREQLDQARRFAGLAFAAAPKQTTLVPAA